MTGGEKIEAAFSKQGTPQIAAVICYEELYIRDHWDQLTDCPWWYQHVPDLERQMKWRCDVNSKTGHDMFILPFLYTYTSEERKYITVEARADGVFRVDSRTGKEEQLIPPPPKIGGWSGTRVVSAHPDKPAQTTDEIDELIPLPDNFVPNEPVKNGSGCLAHRMVEQFGEQMYPITHVNIPLWSTYYTWGFETMMMMMADRPDLIKHACERYLTLAIRKVQTAAALGAQAIWLQEGLTDMISPAMLESLGLPFLCRLVEAIRDEGLKSIHMFGGDPAGKWGYLTSTGADALSLEESKKEFVIDIDDVVEKTQGRCVVLGNLDAIGLLANGTEEQLRAEITRQIAAGRRNKSRFIMSIGSPVTPGTPAEKVRLYCDLVRELGSA